MEDDKVKFHGTVAPSSDNKTIGELLDEFCVFYMSIGVSYNDYWHGDTEMLKCTFLAYQKRETREFEKQNEALYLAGLYNYSAFSAVIAKFAWGLGGGKGEEPKGYVDAPFAFTDNEKKAAEEREKEKAIKWFLNGQKNG